MNLEPGLQNVHLIHVLEIGVDVREHHSCVDVQVPVEAGGVCGQLSAADGLVVQVELRYLGYDFRRAPVAVAEVLIRPDPAEAPL